MTAAATAAAPDVAGEQTVPYRPGDRRSLLLSARLAAAILRPAAIVGESADFLAPLTSQQVRAAAALPGFMPAVNRALRRDIGLTQLNLPRDLPQRLSERSASRLAVLLLVEPLALMQRAAAIVGATILHRQIVSLMMKDQRAAARAAMGEEAFVVATLEAPMLNAGLALLDKGGWRMDSLAGQGTGEAAQARFRAYCGEALCRFVETAEPSLLGFFSCRLPALAKADDKSRLIAGMNDGHCAQIVKLLRRRLPEWADFIG